jgi:glutamate formiminotransferase / formiminotetrahydrofolate cyclodeaminase
MALIECVPNFSEGNDLNKIKQITDAMETVIGIKVLNVDPGKATNRTVVTLVGAPEAVVEAAFRAIQTAANIIDMRTHQGAHPRMGATDVCPLIPISGISMEETARYAVQLAARVGKELDIPVYLYEAAQPNKLRSNLSIIREGEYEGFAKKIKLPEWQPDYGPSTFHAKAGATVIGARDFLIAYNVNLNTKSVKRANSVAFDVREAGRKIKLPDGTETTQPGLCKSVKGIGWFIDEYGIAQVSMNLTDMNTTPLHLAFDACVNSAHARGLRVTGSELIGLVPLKAMTDAGKYFLKKQQRSTGVSDQELIAIAVHSMGLNELSNFNPHERIIEYLLYNNTSKKLINHSLQSFANETASESPAPGGGSISAYLGTLAASLGTMVANLSAAKKGWEADHSYFSLWAEQGQQLKDQLLHLVDEDTASFNKIMEAMALPKQTDTDKQTRTAAIQEATLYAIEVPYQTMLTTFASYPLIAAMIDKGNPNSITDAAVAALCARAAIHGAWLNVGINAISLPHHPKVNEILAHGAQLLAQSNAEEQRLLTIVAQKMQTNR